MFLMDIFIEIIIKLILSPFFAFFILFPFIYISYAIELSQEAEVKRDIFLDRILIITTLLIIIFLVTYEETLYDNIFSSVNDIYISVQNFFELLITNYKLGTIAVAISLLYPLIIPVESPRSNRRTNTIYMFIFLYTFCFLVLSGIPLNTGLEYLESSRLMDYGGPIILLTQVVLGFGPYLIYGITLLFVSILWFGCLVRIIYPDNKTIL
jgi:hypothetical protein